MRVFIRLLTVMLAAALGACASRGPEPMTSARTATVPAGTRAATVPPPTQPAAPAPVIPPPAPPPPLPATYAAPAQAESPLAAEQRWLRALFQGTPVTIDNESDGSLRIEVPLAYSFEPSSPAPKAPLKAVIDRVSQTLLRQLQMQVQVASGGPGARERSAVVRSQLNAKGVALPRIVALTTEPANIVLLRVSPVPVEDAATTTPAPSRGPTR